MVMSAFGAVGMIASDPASQRHGGGYHLINSVGKGKDIGKPLSNQGEQRQVWRDLRTEWCSDFGHRLCWDG